MSSETVLLIIETKFDREMNEEESFPQKMQSWSTCRSREVLSSVSHVAGSPKHPKMGPGRSSMARLADCTPSAGTELPGPAPGSTEEPLK